MWDKRKHFGERGRKMDAKGYISSDASPASKPYIFPIFLYLSREGEGKENTILPSDVNPAPYMFVETYLTIMQHPYFTYLTKGSSNGNVAPSIWALPE